MKNGGAGHMPGVGKVKAYSRNDLRYHLSGEGPGGEGTPGTWVILM